MEILKTFCKKNKPFCVKHPILVEHPVGVVSDGEFKEIYVRIKYSDGTCRECFFDSYASADAYFEEMCNIIITHRISERANFQNKVSLKKQQSNTYYLVLRSDGVYTSAGDIFNKGLIPNFQALQSLIHVTLNVSVSEIHCGLSDGAYDIGKSDFDDPTEKLGHNMLARVKFSDQETGSWVCIYKYPIHDVVNKIDIKRCMAVLLEKGYLRSVLVWKKIKQRG